MPRFDGSTGGARSNIPRRLGPLKSGVKCVDLAFMPPSNGR